MFVSRQPNPVFISGRCTLFTQFLVMSAFMLLEKMSMMNLHVSKNNAGFFWIAVWLMHFFLLLMAIRVLINNHGWFLCSIRSDICDYIGCEGRLWETSKWAPFPWQVRKNLLVFGWNCLEGKIMKVLFSYVKFYVCFPFSFLLCEILFFWRGIWRIRKKIE